MRRTLLADLHQFPDHIPPHHMVKYCLQAGVLHQAELHAVSAILEGWLVGGDDALSELPTNLCHMRMVEVSWAVTVTWKYSSVLTPNHSGESRNWLSVTRCKARPPWETISLTTVATVRVNAVLPNALV